MLELIVLGHIPGTSIYLSPSAIGIGFLLTGITAGVYIAKRRSLQAKTAEQNSVADLPITI